MRIDPGMARTLNYPLLTIVIEGLMFPAGIWIYQRATQARDRIGRWGFWGFVLLGLFYTANLFTPPPPSVTTLAVSVLVFGWLLVL